MAAAADPLAQPRFTSVGVGDIPRGVVATMAQDRAGFLWIATGDGLVRYDGYRFRPQLRDNANPAVRNLGWIRALLGGRDGRLWIGTETDGLVLYDPRQERVELLRGGGPDREPAPTIFALAEGPDGSIWSGSAGGGLQRFDPASRRVTTFRRGPEAGSLPDDRVRSLLFDRQGTLWVGTWSGLVRLQPDSDRFETVGAAGTATLAGQAVQSLVEVGDGHVWAGTLQGDLVAIDPASGQAYPVDQGPDARRRGWVSSMIVAPQGQVWVGRASGISIYEATRARLLRHLRHDVRNPAGLAGNEVTTLLLDQAGWIWAGGFGMGLQRHDPNNHAIRVRGADLQAGSPLLNPDVRSLLALDDGQVWAATHTGGVAILDRALRVVDRLGGATIKPGAGASPAPLDADAMAQMPDGSVWLGTSDGLRQFSRERRLLQRLALPGGLARRLLSTADGTLWVGTQDGLYRLRPQQRTLQRLALHGGRPLGGEIHALAEGPDRSLWVGSGQGLHRLADGADELSAVLSPEGAGLGNPVVIGLMFDRQGSLWLDTAITGLHHMLSWDGRLARFDRVSQRHGILGRPFGANLLQDARGRIWTHMHVYDPAADTLHALTAADGVDMGTGWFFSYTRMTDGRLLFGGSKGLLVVDPARFDIASYAPPLVASELRINGERANVGQIPQGVRITPGQRSFSLEFAALDYSDPARLRYAYQLQGFDPDWIATGADFRVASYSNLDPGEYLLRLRATNRAGVWSPQELHIRVHVLPAWWQQGWFALLAMALLGIALHGVVQWRTRWLRQRQRQLESTVRERTTELEAMTRALQKERAALEQTSLTDPLTGLRNRRFLAQHMDADVSMTLRRYHGATDGVPPQDADLIFFMIDIDHFKAVNDQHGHAAGDAVLEQMHPRLQSVFRDADHLVRWGGEEFLVVARGASRAHAAELAERARAAVADVPFALGDGRQLSLTCSVGFCCFPLSRRHPQALPWTAAVDAADEALYAVKCAGRNGWLGLVEHHGQPVDVRHAASKRPPAGDPDDGRVEWARSPGLGASRPMPGQRLSAEAG